MKRNEQQESGKAGKPGKEAMRLHSEKSPFPRRGQVAGRWLDLGCRQTEKGRKGIWDAEE